MDSVRTISAALILFLLILAPSFSLSSHSRIRLRTDISSSSNVVDSHGRKFRIDDSLYCDSWRFAVETNDAGKWSPVPTRCVDFVRGYMDGGRYGSDSEVVADYAVAFAKSVVNASSSSSSSGGCNNAAAANAAAWVFDIDETLLSNLPYYRDNGYGSESYNATSFDLWVNSAKAPALPASLRLYNELKKLNFTIFLLTGRSESERNATIQNLLFAGYSGWKKLFLRGASDSGKLATVYKSEKRKEIESAGYTIQGSSGDQWSDLNGFAVAARSFKLPNPMYYVA